MTRDMICCREEQHCTLPQVLAKMAAPLLGRWARAAAPLNFLPYPSGLEIFGPPPADILAVAALPGHICHRPSPGVLESCYRGHRIPKHFHLVPKLWQDAWLSYALGVRVCSYAEREGDLEPSNRNGAR